MQPLQDYIDLDRKRLKKVAGDQKRWDIWQKGRKEGENIVLINLYLMAIVPIHSALGN